MQRISKYRNRINSEQIEQHLRRMIQLTVYFEWSYCMTKLFNQV